MSGSARAKPSCVASDHYGQRARRRAVRPAGHRRVDVLHAEPGEPARGLARADRVAARVVDPELAWTQPPGKRLDDRVDLPARRQASEDHVGRRAIGDVGRHRRAVLRRVALGNRLRPVPDDDLVLLSDVSGHRIAHRSEADECCFHGFAPGVKYVAGLPRRDEEHSAGLERRAHADRGRPRGAPCPTRAVRELSESGGKFAVDRALDV